MARFRSIAQDQQQIVIIPKAFQFVPDLKDMEYRSMKKSSCEVILAGQY